jgi:prevent-host-death family protein
MAKDVDTVGAFEAKTHLSELLERVKAGREITITKRGSPVAKLVPITRRTTADQRAAAIKRILERSALLSFGGGRIADLTTEGRK